MSGLITPNRLKGPFSRPFELFPAEVWALIFERVTDPQDLLNIMHSADDWYWMLEQQRKYLLFPQVLEILGKQQSLRKTTSYLMTGEAGLYDRVPTPLLNCRKVCKTWDRMIQNYIQLHPKHFDVNIPAASSVLDDAAYTFNNEKQVRKFVNTFGASHCSPDRNPFVSRHVVIEDCAPITASSDSSDSEEGDEDIQSFPNCVARFLKKFGTHIYHLTIRFRNPEHPSTLYRLLQRWISLTNNIQTLQLSFCPRGISVEQLGATEQREFSGLVILKPMPTLGHLKFLKARNVQSVIFQNLLQNNDHVEKLVVAVWDYLPARYDIYFERIVLNNLQECSIDLRTLQDLHLLKSALAARTWPVKTLRINCMNDKGFSDFDFGVNGGGMTWNDLCRGVETIAGPELTNLRLTMPTSCSLADRRFTLSQSYQLRLNFPQLKELVVQLPFLSSIDFLLSLEKSLEELRIIVDYRDKSPMTESDKEREQIKFNGLFDRMDESTIWELLPKLKLLEIVLTNNWEELQVPAVRYLYEKNRRNRIVKHTLEEEYSGRFKMNRVLELPPKKY